MSRLDEQLARLAAMSTTELKQEWERVFKTPAPPLGGDLICRALTYRLQERVHGGLPVEARRRIGRLVAQLRRGEEIAAERDVVIKTGTRLVREWHGRTHHVLVLDTGYLFEDRRYSSLSSIANHITGVRWSGPRFFGLRRRPKAFAAGSIDG